MPLPAFSSESGLESDAHHLNNVSSSCASSAPPAVPPAPGPPAPGRIVFPLPGGLAHHHHYKALQQAAAAAAAMSSGDNFVQAPGGGGGGRTPAAGLISAPVHAIMPLPSRVVHDGRLWTSSFHHNQVMPSGGVASQQQQQHQQQQQQQHDMTSAACAARAHDDGGNNKMVDNTGPAAVTEEHGSNNELGGGSFAEHDYMSDVSSAPNDDTSNKCGERGGAMDGGKGDDAQDTDDSNLRETELRLGPPESAGLLSGAKRGFSEAMGGLSESKRSFSDTAAAAAAAAAVLSSGEHKLLPLGVSPRNGSAAAAAAGAYTDSRVSPMISSSPSPAAPGSFADVRSTYFDSRPACLFDHYNGDGKGVQQQVQQQGGSSSGFRVPTRPPPWQVLDHSAASLGPFPSPKVPLDVSNSLGGKPGAADAPPVVGWPPVRAFRKSSLSSPTGGASAKPVAECANATSAAPAAAAGTGGVSPAPAPAASPASPALVPGAQPPRPGMEGMPKGMRPTPGVGGAAGAENGCRASGAPSSSPSSVTSNHWFVKVYMDGVPFGRKVDLRIHGCYDKLSVGLEEMFTRYANVEQGSNGESKPLKFLQGSDYVLTYEDQDGDLMLVGDVPWNMFITSVKRLRIMKSSEAVGIAPRNSPKLWKAGAA